MEGAQPSIGASHQISVLLAKKFQIRRFLEIDQPETRIAYGSHVCKRIGTKLTAIMLISIHILFVKIRLYIMDVKSIKTL
jgi:hypothetical protein